MPPVDLRKLAALVRSHILTMTTAAGSGHPTSSLSAVELLVTLFFKYLTADLDAPKNPNSDRVIFSKGHASPLFYGLYASAGKISKDEMLTYRQFDSNLEGHPSMRFPYTEVPTGSLGQGLAVGAGEALALKMNQELRIKNQEKKTRFQKIRSPRQRSTPFVFVLLGDGELAEGSVWEAANWAGQRRLDNLVALVDINRLGQSADTMFGHDIAVYKKRFEAFGWRAMVISNGNSIGQVDAAFAKIKKGKAKPVVLLAKTKKGSGVSFLEGAAGWHGKALGKEELVKALRELGAVDTSLRGKVQKPEWSDALVGGPIFRAVRSPSTSSGAASPDVSKSAGLPASAPGDMPVATRKAFGAALARLGSVYPNLVVLDADVKNSTYTEEFEKIYPGRFVQFFIAEQLMIGAGVGLAARGYKVVAATFGAFLSRPHDQLRMAAQSGLPLVICGSHAGVSIGEDGPSQMALEDIALFRSLPGSVVVYPSDAVSAERLTELLLARERGISYIRTNRPATPLLYTNTEQFSLGGSKTFPPPKGLLAKATVVAAGITLHEALKAQASLAGEGVGIRVIDCYSVKPIDRDTLRSAASDSALIIVEDHYPEGGLGEAVLSAIHPLKENPCKVVHLAVRKLPRSGKPDELLAYEEIDTSAIVRAVKEL